MVQKEGIIKWRDGAQGGHVLIACLIVFFKNNIMCIMCVFFICIPYSYLPNASLEVDV